MIIKGELIWVNLKFEEIINFGNFDWEFSLYLDVMDNIVFVFIYDVIFFVDLDMGDIVWEFD